MSLAALAARSAALCSRSACMRSAAAVVAVPAPTFAACSVAPAAAARAFHASCSSRALFGFGGSKDSKDSKDSAAPAAAASSSAPAASGSAPAGELSGLDLEKSKAAKKAADQSRMQAEAEATFWSAFKAIMLRPEFKFKDWEELSKLQSGGGGGLKDTSDLGMFDRAKLKLREKVQASGLVPQQQSHVELKPVLAVLTALTPAEKESSRASLPIAVKERVALSTGQSVAELTRILFKFDQLCVVSKWFKYRTSVGAKLPANHQQMQDWMSDDRREKKFQQQTMLEMALKPKPRRTRR